MWASQGWPTDPGQTWGRGLVSWPEWRWINRHRQHARGQNVQIFRTILTTIPIEQCLVIRKLACHSEQQDVNVSWLAAFYFRGTWSRRGLVVCNRIAAVWSWVWYYVQQVCASVCTGVSWLKHVRMHVYVCMRTCFHDTCRKVSDAYIYIGALPEQVLAKANTCGWCGGGGGRVGNIYIYIYIYTYIHTGWKKCWQTWENVPQSWLRKAFKSHMKRGIDTYVHPYIHT